MPPIERSFSAETLRAFRAWLGLSQEDVASILGISTRSVQTYEGQGGPEWMRYALLGWAVLIHGTTPRAATRYLGLPWEHHPLPGSPADESDADQSAARLAGQPMRLARVDKDLEADLKPGPEGVELDDAPGATDQADALVARHGKVR